MDTFLEVENLDQQINLNLKNLIAINVKFYCMHSMERNQLDYIDEEALKVYSI